VAASASALAASQSTSSFKIAAEIGMRREAALEAEGFLARTETTILLKKPDGP
jgi:hypothetical protein